MGFFAITRTHIAPIGLLLIATAMLVGCTADGTKPWRPAPVMPTAHAQQQYSAQCWMETEHGEHGAKKGLPLAKRAEIVDKCVQDKMNGAP